MLQPGYPFSAKILGRSELKTLIAPEPDGQPWLLTDFGSLACLYANELLVACCAEHDPHPLLFDAYKQLLSDLSSHTNNHAQHTAVRRFERTLLCEIGYDINYSSDAEGKPMNKHASYSLSSDWSFVAHPQGKYPGSSLVALAHNRYPDAATIQVARMLTRDVLQRVLDKPLNSWRLFR